MVANQSNMLDIFNRCNIEYFKGELLFPQFDLLHSKNTCGYFHYSKGGLFDNTIYDPVISITDYYDFTEKQFIDIMCHEMIHYYLACNGIDRKVKHGKEFQRMAEQLNRTYGLQIPTYTDLSMYKRNMVRFSSHQLNKKNKQMRFFKEVWGFIFEFNSVGEYFIFVLGRLLGVVIFIGILLLLYYLLYHG